jgi:predicted regulator of Ras-like GTPase activity (Roadblock/LC7/MglB family)
MSQHVMDRATQYLDGLARRIGAKQAVVASRDGLLVAGTSGRQDDLEELAAFAPSQLPDARRSSRGPVDATPRGRR